MSASGETAPVDDLGTGLAGIAASPWLLAVLIVICLTAVAWLSQLQQQLPGGQTPGSSSDVLYPGEYSVTGAAVRSTGSWLQVPLGPVTWLTADAPGAGLVFTFYGTRVTATMRMGPQAGTAYVSVDGRPAPQLHVDKHGSYVSLAASRAVAEPVSLVSGLSHGQHTLTITNGAAGELAIASLDVASQTPSPWAFAMVYTLAFLMLVALVRALLMQIATRLGWLTGGPALSIGYSRRRTR